VGVRIDSAAGTRLFGDPDSGRKLERQVRDRNNRLGLLTCNCMDGRVCASGPTKIR
jgi:hypothetical protein